MLTKEGFKYTSPPKKTAKGQGLHYGTFNEKPYEHVTQNKAPKKTAEKVKAYEPRNFYTNSASKDFNDVDYIPDDYGAIEKAKKVALFLPHLSTSYVLIVGILSKQRNC